MDDSGRTADRPPAAIGYLVTRFPKTTETFVYREVEELRARATPVHVYALHRERDGLVQPEATGFAPTVRYAAGIAGCLAALGRWTLRRPLRLWSTVGLVLWANRRSPDFAVKGVVAVAQGASLTDRVRADGVRLVHAHFATHGAVAAMTIARLLDVRWSTTVHAHDLYAQTSGLEEKLKRADLVVTISEFNRALLRRRFGVDSVIVRYGLDLTRFRPRGWRACEQPWELASVGRLNALKGHHHLVRACAILRDRGIEARCTIAGEGPLRDELLELVDSLDLGDRVTLLGSVPGPRVDEILRECDCFVLACDVEPDGTMDGLPNALIEAEALGVPTVSTDVSGVGELVIDGRTGRLVEPRDPVALADAISSLCLDDELRRRVTAEGPEWVRTHFDIRRSVDDLERHFADALGRS